MVRAYLSFLLQIERYLYARSNVVMAFEITVSNMFCSNHLVSEYFYSP